MASALKTKNVSAVAVSSPPSTSITPLSKNSVIKFFKALYLLITGTTVYAAMKQTNLNQNAKPSEIPTLSKKKLITLNIFFDFSPNSQKKLVAGFAETS